MSIPKQMSLQLWPGGPTQQLSSKASPLPRQHVQNCCRILGRRTVRLRPYPLRPGGVLPHQRTIRHLRPQGLKQVVRHLPLPLRLQDLRSVSPVQLHLPRVPQGFHRRAPIPYRLQKGTSSVERAT